mgnify:CR=1 FL=1
MLRVIAGLALIAVLATAGVWWLSDEQSAAAPQRPPTTVNVVPAISRPLSDNLEVVGTARATRAIVLLTQVDGRVDTIHFQESQEVQAGDLLVTLDDRAARAETNRTRADYQRALSDYQRASRLAGGSAISEAEVANLKTTMESARASMDASRAALEDHTLRAPFDGVVGLRQVDQGAFLQVGDAVTTLDSVRNLEVNFQVPERYLSDIRPDLTVEVTSDAYPGKVFRGKIAMLGLPSKPIPVDFGALVLKAITLKGVYGREMFETWYKMIAMLESGLDVSRVITHRYAADEFQKGFDAMRSGKSGKVILDWTAP